MAKTMSVQVKDAPHYRDAPFLGKVVTKLSYADQVTVEQEQHSWVKVSRSGQKNGWIHISALSEKEIILNPNSEEIKEAASGEEIALAGKGFNKQVEEKFKQDNKNIDFTRVDKMEKMVISQTEIQNFISQGGLKAGEGES